MPSISVILKRAKALIDTPEKLCKHSYAKDKAGNNCPGTSKHAVAFCMHGAIFRTCMALSPKIEREAEMLLAEANGLTVVELTAHSDTNTHAEIMDAYDRAIALALERQGGKEEDEAAPAVVYSDADEPEPETPAEVAQEATKKARKPRTKKEPPKPQTEPEAAAKPAIAFVKDERPLALPTETYNAIAENPAFTAEGALKAFANVKPENKPIPGLGAFFGD